MRLLGRGGFVYQIENCPFSSDAEGPLHHVRDRSGYVARIYPPFHDDDWIIDLHDGMAPTDRCLLASQASIAVDVLRESSGLRKGVIASWVAFETNIASYYRPEAYGSLSERLHVAQNLCRAVANIHDAGMAVGDMNSDNILVERGTSRVFVRRLARRDSPACAIVGQGASEWIPPALQGESFAASMPLERLQAIDNFGLAVHLFALFSRGRHPLSYRSSSQEKISRLATRRMSVPVPPPLAAMGGTREGWDLLGGTVPIPCYRLGAARFPRSMRALFRRAFSEAEGDLALLPSPDEWLVGIDAFSATLRARVSAAVDKAGIPARSPDVEGGPSEPVSQELRELCRWADERRGARYISDPRLYRAITLAFAGMVGLCFFPGAPGMAVRLLHTVWSLMGAPGLSLLSGVWPFAFAGAVIGLLLCWFHVARARSLRPIDYSDYLAAFCASSAGCLLTVAIVLPFLAEVL